MTEPISSLSAATNRTYRQLAAKFPLVAAQIPIGGRDWHVTAVQNQDALLDGAEELENFPYGFLLWEAAVGLSRCVANAPELVRGKRILELGTGVGLAGMVAQSLGANVVQTDHQAGALALAQVNAVQNNLLSLPQFLADWRIWRHTEKYDILLGADILYERAMHFYLEQIFQINLKPQGTLLFGDPGRPQAMEFIAHLEKSGWNFTLETQTVLLDEEGRDNRPVEVAVYAGKRTGS